MARFILGLFFLFGLSAAAVPPQTALLSQVKQVTQPYQFDFVAWETATLGQELARRVNAPPLPESAPAQIALVRQFLAAEAAARQVRRELEALYATGNDRTDKAKRLEAQLSQVKEAQAALTPLVETILIKQMETILIEQGFALRGQVIPPLTFRFINPPTALILSPRDRIENIHISNLQPDLRHQTRREIESNLEQRGDVSSYVTDIGGLGSYPTMVLYSSSLTWLVEVIAHEWTHNYLFTFPTNIAWGYQTFPQLRTINETTAELVGQEIGRAMITRYYPEWIDQLPPLTGNGLPGSPEPSEFDLAMRRIRQQVDTLLAEAKIEPAEAYMEAERLKLVERGYNLPRLNQAYFAFHGAYTLGPDSIDPTGDQLRQLRTRSASLKEFLDRVGWLNSYDEFLAWLNEED